MDAASSLAACGKRCTVVSSTAFWRVQTEVRNRVGVVVSLLAWPSLALALALT